eukprot:15342270-Ditylum_brightwellii.AAC.1
MTFGLNTWAVLTLKNGCYLTTNILPEILKLDDDSNKGYCYLSIMEVADFHTVEVKQNTVKEYISRVQKSLMHNYPEIT